MVTPTLLVDGLVGLAIASVYAYVARVFHQRSIGHQDSRLAGRAFIVWWLSLALLTALGAARSILAGVDVLTLHVHEAITTATLPFMCLALWGLVYYLFYVHSGSRAWLVPVTAYHALLFLAFAYLVAWLEPTRIEATAWRVDAHNARALEGVPLVAVTLSILAPALIAAAMYGSLFFRTEDAMARYRIGLVSAAFVAWFGSSLLASTLRLHEAFSYWPLVSRFLGLLAALAVAAAYRPPRKVHDRLLRREVGL